MDAVVDKIAKLLRMAKDRAGSPEGETFLRRAQIAMEKARITVELNDDGDVYRAVADDDISEVAGVYPEIESWRQHVVTLIQMLYGIQAFWTNGLEDTSLIFSAPANRQRALRSALEYYAKLTRVIDEASLHCPTQINTGVQAYSVRRRDPRVIRLFRRGVVDVWVMAICQHVDRVRAAAQRRPASPSASLHLGPSTHPEVTDDPPVEAGGETEDDETVMALTEGVQCTALVRVQAFRRQVHDIPSAPPPEAEQRPHEAQGAENLDQLVYDHGAAYARRVRVWPVPASEDLLDEAPEHSAH